MEDCYKNIIANTIENAKWELKDINNFLWSNPETAYEEFKAHDKLTAYLEEKGFTIKRKTPTDTAFLATFLSPHFSSEQSQKRPVHAALLCEYDALPTLGHACGHNLIAVIALAAAVAIKEVLLNHLIFGQVTVIGSPAEETGGGKIDHIKSDHFNCVDFALISHPGSVNRSAPQKLFRQQLKAVYLGVVAHASKNPWLGRNALDAVVLAYQNISCLRQQFVPGWQVQAIITKGGDAVNVIPDNAEMSILIRTVNKQDLNQLRERLTHCLQGAAMSTNTSVQIIEHGHIYENMIQNRVLESLYICYFKERNQNISTKELSTINRPSGSTDMGNVSHLVPALHPVYQISDSQAHTKEFQLSAGGEDAFQRSLNQAEVLAEMSINLMTDLKLLESVKEEFLQSIFERSQ